jgi:hypothetical protein
MKQPTGELQHLRIATSDNFDWNDQIGSAGSESHLVWYDTSAQDGAGVSKVL